VTLLLDTHTTLWWLSGSALSKPARSAIADPDTTVLVSSASAWEMAIKAALGRLDMPADLGSALATSGFDVLEVSLEHALAVRDLPPLHRDPFDRMLVAQALCEGAVLVTRDARLADYGVRVLSA
jgi:PIN domain nuclease of toxin-antitoxin system